MYYFFQLDAADGSLSSIANRDSRNPEKTPEELQAALMSLHLRDLRCQQLSLEINKVRLNPIIHFEVNHNFSKQLLEERDALQLKLSASLRQNQELTRELSQSQNLPAPTTPPASLKEK